MNREERNAYMRDWNKKNYHKNLEKSRERARNSYHKNKFNNKQKLLQRAKEYRDSHKEELKIKNRLYRESHKDVNSLRGKAWREKNKEHIKEYQKEYHNKNLDKWASYERNRRAKKSGNWGSIPSWLWEQILEFYGNVCLCCGTSNDITQDHILPLSKGGKHTPENVQPLCGTCNYRKHTKTTDYRNGRIFVFR